MTVSIIAVNPATASAGTINLETRTVFMSTPSISTAIAATRVARLDSLPHRISKQPKAADECDLPCDEHAGCHQSGLAFGQLEKRQHGEHGPWRIGHSEQRESKVFSHCRFPR